MGVTWTEEQQKVIDLRDRNILVSAAAGSGKTAVLVERIITMLTDQERPVSVDRLLIVTFTEAAAAEMKERIRAAIEKKAEERPEDEHLRRQATLIHHAQITTIHSFCLSVIRDHFHVIDLDPGFRIGEEGELKLLRHDVLEEMLEARYEEAGEAYLDFVSAYGGARSDKRIEELILKIYEFSRSYPDPERWLGGIVEAYGAETAEELEQSAYVERIRSNVSRYLEDAEELLLLGLSICREADGPGMYEEALLLDMHMAEAMKKEETFEGLSRQMRSMKWAKLAPNRDKNVSVQKAEQVKAIREEVKTLFKDMAAQYFYEDMEGMLEDIRLCRPHIEELADLVGEFARRFEEKKREKELIDFSDMEQYALHILTVKERGAFSPSAVAREYQEQFLEIMIDEYQDSNLIQEAILTSISTVGEGRYNIFMVGDVKQSIYRFRLSRPKLFMEKFDAYSLEGGKEQRIDLHKNFRSRKEVLDSANYIFRQIMTRGLGGVAYNDEAALYPGAQYPSLPEAQGGHEGDTAYGSFPMDAQTEVLVIDPGEEGEERELEARAIAGRIRELMQSQQVLDKGTGELRSLRYGDIVILVRSIRGFADIFTEVLNREGIPAYAGTKEGYFAAQEIGVLLDYLRVLDNEQQDIPLAAVLSSSFGGLMKTELAILKSRYKELPFHQAVFRFYEEWKEGEKEKDKEDRTIGEKLDQCLSRLERLREIVPYTPIHELLQRILSDTGYGDLVAAMPGGAQRTANLEMLVEKARMFESAAYKGLYHFVRYIGQLQKYNVDYGEAALNDEQADTVRIMTIHKSKGLEFPVVFVAGMGKRFNMQDARSSVALHVDLGVGLDAIDLERRTKSPSLLKKAIQKEEALDSLGEELRVLYVALTRAKEKLILTGTMADLEKKMEGYDLVKGREKEELSFARLSRASTYWDWILPALARLTPDVPIRVHRMGVEDIVREEVGEEAAARLKQSVLEAWDTDKVYDEEMRKMLEEQLSFSYAYEGSHLCKIKYTVSELKKRAHLMELAGSEAKEEEFGQEIFEEPDVVPLIPRFLRGEEETLTGAGRGTAYHRLLELLDFRKDYTEQSLGEEIEGLREKGKMTDEMAAGICLKDILHFLGSSVGARMKKCAMEGTLRREQPFVLGVEEVGETVLVQGIIDVYFEEPDGLVVLDYKTDRIRTAEELREKYHAQLDYYGEALERLTEKKVKEKIIYSFFLQEIVEV